MLFDNLSQIKQITTEFQSFHNSLVISTCLFVIITIFVGAVETLLYKIENKLITSDDASYLTLKLIIWIVELIAANLVFFLLGSFLFSSITSSYYIIYQITFCFNLIFTLLRFSVKIYYLVRAES